MVNDMFINEIPSSIIIFHGKSIPNCCAGCSTNDQPPIPAGKVLQRLGDLVHRRAGDLTARHSLFSERVTCWGYSWG